MSTPTCPTVYTTRSVSRERQHNAEHKRAKGDTAHVWAQASLSPSYACLHLPNRIPWCPLCALAWQRTAALPTALSFTRRVKRDKHTSEHTHMPHGLHNAQCLTRATAQCRAEARERRHCTCVGARVSLSCACLHLPNRIPWCPLCALAGQRRAALSTALANPHTAVTSSMRGAPCLAVNCLPILAAERAISHSVSSASRWETVHMFRIPTKFGHLAIQRCSFGDPCCTSALYRMRISDGHINEETFVVVGCTSLWN